MWLFVWQCDCGMVLVNYYFEDVFRFDAQKLVLPRHIGLKNWYSSEELNWTKLTNDCAFPCLACKFLPEQLGRAFWRKAAEIVKGFKDF